uniref:Uncharacterized protein n=1 Tax=Eutreptiella gymnastica TaxID=73025 RepID=A0A7S1HV34_9EUGL
MLCGCKLVLFDTYLCNPQVAGLLVSPCIHSNVNHLTYVPWGSAPGSPYFCYGFWFVRPYRPYIYQSGGYDSTPETPSSQSRKELHIAVYHQARLMQTEKCASEVCKTLFSTHFDAAEAR